MDDMKIRTIFGFVINYFTLAREKAESHVCVIIIVVKF